MPILNGLAPSLITTIFFAGQNGAQGVADQHITILMATCNGAQFLAAQLDSLLVQTHCNWSLVVSDDGSCDATLPILHAFDRAHPRHKLRLITGPCLGSAAQNFMSLLTREDLPRGSVALADQDDVWLPCKLARAMCHLQHLPDAVPAIYGAGSALTDANLVPLRQKSEPMILPSFRNALVQNIFSGHSMALNSAALDLIKAVGAPPRIEFHDWWLYQLVAGAGGNCVLDDAKTVLYRQHGGNSFGTSHSVRGALKRVQHLARNDYSNWLVAHWRALQDAGQFLAPASRHIVRDLLHPCKSEPRAAQFHRLGLHRSSAKGTAALHLAARFGWV